MAIFLIIKIDDWFSVGIGFWHSYLYADIFINSYFSLMMTRAVCKLDLCHSEPFDFAHTVPVFFGRINSGKSLVFRSNLRQNPGFLPAWIAWQITHRCTLTCTALLAHWPTHRAWCSASVPWRSVPGSVVAMLLTPSRSSVPSGERHAIGFCVHALIW